MTIEKPPPLGAEDWQKWYLTRFDGIDIEISFRSYPTQDADVVVKFQIYPTNSVEIDWISLRLLDAVGSDRNGRYSYNLSIQTSYSSWGAAGAGTTFLLEVSSGALGGVAAQITWNSMELLRKQLVDRLKPREIAPLVRDDAVSFARREVENSYGIDSEQLAVTGERHDVQRQCWEIEMVAAGNVYRVVLGALEGDPSTWTIERRASGPPTGG